MRATGRPVARSAARCAVRCAGRGVAVAALLSVSAASAQVAPVRIALDADSGCVDEATFLAAVAAQTPNLHPPAPGSDARRLSIRVARAPGVLLGSLRADELDGTSSVREVTASDCAELASALALVTALAVDAGPPPPRIAPPPPPLPPLPPLPPAPPVAAPAPPPTPSPRRHMRFEIGALGVVVNALAPQLSWGVSPFVDWSEWGRSGVAPSVRAAFAVAWSPTATTATGAASFRWLAARVSGCPLALAVGRLTARPCLGIDAGALQGQGASVTLPFSASKPWVAPVLLGRLHLRATSWLVAEAELGAFVPLIHEDFTFQLPNVDIHEVPPVGGFASLGLGVVLP